MDVGTVTSVTVVSHTVPFVEIVLFVPFVQIVLFGLILHLVVLVVVLRINAPALVERSL